MLTLLSGNLIEAGCTMQAGREDDSACEVKWTPTD